MGFLHMNLNAGNPDLVKLNFTRLANRTGAINSDDSE